MFKFRDPITLNRAISCGLVNQLATPGLGSFMGRRFKAGLGQLSLALAGFFLITSWMCALFYFQICEQLGKTPRLKPHDKWWQIGLILFVASWCWALVTSISLLREAARNREIEAQRPLNKPPRLS